MKINLFIKKILESKYTPIIFFVVWFVLFVLLSLLRDSNLDENIYIGDSVEIANILQRGEWIGNYGIGLHGFLNKLVVGIVFIFTGPSVFIATLSNILFGIFSGVLFYRILLKHFKFTQIYSLLGVSLLFCSFQFLTYTPTFYRDIVALFFSLLVLNSILNKNSKWLTGLFLLLLLDSKEHVFYTVAIALVIWIGVESYIHNKGKFIQSLKGFILNGLKLFLPSLVFLILMFATSIIPLNIYNGNILGLIDGGIKPMASNFDLDMATHNRDIEINKESARIMPTIDIPEGSSSFTLFSLSLINIILSYIGKILYPRTFSFLSVPFIILIPSIWFAYKYFEKCIRKEYTTKLVLPILLFVYLSIYILHASISRYIVPISPIIFLFFLMFLRKLSPEYIYTRKIFLLTFMFVVAGLYFEYSYVLIKIIINTILFSIFLLICFGKGFKKENLKYLFIILVSTFFIGTSLLSSYSYGQIKGYRLYGYDRECEKIVSLVKDSESIWINDINWDRLPFVLREENLGDPEWRWNLQEWIPKKDMLKSGKESRTYNFYWSNTDNFKENLLNNNVSKVVYIKLKIQNEKESLLLQDRLEILQNTKWLDLEQKVEMKNKDVYIFKVNLNVND